MAKQSGGAIRAGRAFVELLLKDNKFLKGMDRVSARMKAFGAATAGVGFKTWAIASTAVAAPLAALTHHFTETGGALVDMAARTGLSIELLSELGFAASQAGAAIEDVEAASKKFSKTISEAAAGSDTARQSLRDLGLSWQALADMPPDQQFATLAAAIGRIDDPTKRTAAALELFGKSGTKLIPILQDLDAQRAAARNSGLSISAADAEAADQLGDRLGEIFGMLKAGAFNIAASFAPDLQAVADLVGDVVRSVTKWIKENRPLIATILKIGTVAGLAVAGIGALLVGIGGASAALGFILSGIVSALGALSAIVGVVFSPIGAIVAALVGLGALVEWQFGLFSKLWAKIKTGARSAADDAKSAFGGIRKALAAGDLGLAAQIGLAYVRLAFATSTQWIRSKWAASATVMRLTWINLAATLETAWAHTVGFLQDVWGTFCAVFKGGFLKASGFIQKLWVRLKGLFDDSINVDVEIARIDAETNQGILANQDDYLKGVREREKERKKRLAEIEAERRKAEEDAGAQGANEQDAIRREIEELRRKLREATGKADALPMPGDEGSTPGKYSGLADAAAGMEQKIGQVTGTFSADVAGRLGAGSPLDRIAKATEKTAKESEKANRRGIKFDHAA